MCSRRNFLLLLALTLLTIVQSVLAAWPPPVPTSLALEVSNGTTFARGDELVRAGVPLPRSLNLTSTANLAVVEENGSAVPASFRVLARWHAARTDLSAPIQWLLVRFRSSLSAGQTRRYRLSFSGISNPAPTTALTLVNNASVLSINTGVARFVLGATADAFDRIESPVGTVLVNSASVSSSIDAGPARGFSSIRRIVVEHVDPISAVVIVEGEFAHPSVGGGAVSGGRRMEFAAGSAAVSVREWIDWEGSRCNTDVLVCAAQINALALQSWRVNVVPVTSGARQIGLQSVLSQNLQSATVAVGNSASLRQRRRERRTDPQRFELELPAQAPQSGTRADAGLALLSSDSGRIGVALRAMPDFEPQALRLLADGALAIDLADDGVWLGNHQGAFAEYRIGAFAPGISAETASAQLWPALNAPLLALPSAQWIAASQASDEFPVGTLPTELAGFDLALNDLIQRTQALRRDRGLEGLMTFGLFPRNWGNPVLSDEIDCGDDPTPTNDWDDPYWCAFWTDYHNTSASAVLAAWRYRDPSPLHTISHPAAMRQLHTQMIRCGPNDPYFYCGQVPTGYRGYRTDFNSSHQYIENLMLNYWMSGDRTIVERLQRGVASYRGYLCPARGNTPLGPVCAADAPITDDFAGVNDRVASQFYQIFRFVGLTSDDVSYLDDWRSNSARFLTQNFAMVVQNGRELGFTEPSGGGNTSIISGPGSYYSTQLWMASIYDFNVLYRLQIDSQDAPLGLPLIAPSRARQAWARSLRAASLLPVGNGTAAGVWPNSLRFTFTGSRIGGSLTVLEPGWAPGPMPGSCLDECLYDPGKSALTATLARAADDLNDSELRGAALDLARYSIDRINAQPMPMGKTPGENFGRLSSAVARLALSEAPLFAHGFEDP